MSEIAARYVTIYPKIANGFSTEINAAVNKGLESPEGAAKAGESTGKAFGSKFSAQVQAAGRDSVAVPSGAVSAAGSSSGKTFGSKFGTEVRAKVKDAVSSTGSGPAASTAGAASGKKFGQGFANSVQKVVNAIAIAGSIGSQFQAAVDKSEGSVSSMSAAAAMAAINVGSLDTEFAKVQNKIFFFQTGAKAANSMGDALKRVVNGGKGFEGFGNQLNGFLAGMVGTKTAAGELSGQVDKLDQALAGMDAAKAQRSFQQITEAAQKQGVGVEDLIHLFPEYKATLQAQAAALGVAEPSLQEYADWMGGKLPAAVIAAANANPELAAQLNITTSSMKDAEAATKGAAKATETYLEKITRLQNKQLEMSDAQMGWEASLDDAADSLKKNGKTLDIHTEKGRANRQALNDIASSALGVAQAMKDQGKSDSEVSAKMSTMRDRFIEVAKKMGLSKTEAEKLATALGLIKDKKVTVTTVYATVTQKGRQTARAFGGAISGPGTGTSDEVPIWASNGEWVIREKASSYYGPRIMSAINQGRIPRSAFAGFASGGPVMPSYNGHSLEWWKDYLLSDLDYTRLQIQIRDLKNNLVERETYNPPGKRKKATRQKLRGLDRTEAQQELKDAQEKLALAKQAAQANSQASGSIDSQLAEYEKAQKSYEDAAAIWQSAASSLAKSSGFGSLDSVGMKRTNAAGDVWYEKRATTAADLASRVTNQAQQVATFIGLLDQLRQSGASEALVSDVMSLGTVEGTKAAQLFLADATQRAVAEAGYASLQSSQNRLNAIGDAAGISVTINEAATPQATAQAVTNKLLAGRT